jgi:hypothetical protein
MNLPEIVAIWIQNDLVTTISTYVLAATQKNSPSAKALSEKRSGIFMPAVTSQWEDYKFDFCFMIRSVLIFDCFSSQLNLFITAL